MSFGGSFGHGRSHGCGCGPTRQRRSVRVVYGHSVPCFTIKVGEILDVTIDVSDEARFGTSEVGTAAPVPSFVSALDGSASTGNLSTSTVPPTRDSVDVLINAQDTNLMAGEVWRVDTDITLTDGRVVKRSFTVKVQTKAGSHCAPVSAAHCPETPAAPQPGVIISGSGQTVPITLSAGLFTLTPPNGATYATVQFHCPSVWTVTGATPSDVNSIGNQVTAGTLVVLQTRNEIDSFRFTGTNDGADPTQAFVEYYTAAPA